MGFIKIPQFVSIAVTLILLSAMATLSSSEKHEISVENKDFNVSYEVTMSKDSDPKTSKIEFEITAKTSGWVGIGFNDKAVSFYGADMCIGAVNLNPNYVFLGDFHVPLQTESDTAPLWEENGNYTLEEASEKVIDGANVTHFRISRFLDTGDYLYDVAIKDEPLTFLWAYNTESDNPATNHTHAGFVKEINFLASSSTSSMGIHSFFMALVFIALTLS